MPKLERMLLPLVTGEEKDLGVVGWRRDSAISVAPEHVVEFFAVVALPDLELVVGGNIVGSKRFSLHNRTEVSIHKFNYYSLTPQRRVHLRGRHGLVRKAGR